MDSSGHPLLLRALTSRGWCFRDSERIEGLITAQLSSGGGFCTVDLIESELLNMDLRSIGGKSLPEPSAPCEASHIRGPMVLRVSSCRDIARSSVGETSGNRRLLLLKLTDGHSEANSVELPHVHLKLTASVPVQNQVAAQKLLQKSTQPNNNSRNSENQRYRGKGKQEESDFLTLDEWVRRKTGNDLRTTSEFRGISQDEVLARQLQQQLDLEDIQEQRSCYTMDADNVKMSMFDFERDGPRVVGRDEFRGRGRGRGRTGKGRIPH